MRMRRMVNDRRADGGFLESILACMVVITAASFFLLALTASAVSTVSNVDQEDLLRALRDHSLWPDGEALEIEVLPTNYQELPPIEGSNGLLLIYREMGRSAPLLVLGERPLEDVDALSMREPVVLVHEGRRFAGMVEVVAW